MSTTENGLHEARASNTMPGLEGVYLKTEEPAELENDQLQLAVPPPDLTAHASPLADSGPTALADASPTAKDAGSGPADFLSLAQPQRSMSPSVPAHHTRGRSSSHEDLDFVGHIDSLQHCSISRETSASDQQHPTQRGETRGGDSTTAGTLPSRSSAEGLTVEEETRGYLQKAREYIERLGGAFIEEDYSVTISVRTSGASAGSHDRYLHAPDGTRLRSLPELARHLGLLQDAPAAVLQQEASHALGPSLSGRERRPVNRLVASEETELPQLAKKHLPASTLSGSKRDFVDPEEPLGGPRRRKLPNGAWEKLPPRRAMLGTVLSSMDGSSEGLPVATGVQEHNDGNGNAALPTVPEHAPPATGKPKIVEDMQIPVVCGGKEGLLFFPSRSVICHCNECAGKPPDERTMRCTVFEAHCGKGSAKKWMDSVLVNAPDAASLCGKALPKVKFYLKAKGVDLSKPTTDPQKASKASKGSSAAKGPSSGPGQSSEARKLVQWAIRRKRSNTSPDERPPETLRPRLLPRADAVSPTQRIAAALQQASATPGEVAEPQVPTHIRARTSLLQSSGRLHELSLQSAMQQQSELLARAQNPPAHPRLPASAPPGASNPLLASRDPRISSPPSPNLTVPSMGLGLLQPHSRAPHAFSRSSILSPGSHAVSDQLVADVRTAMGHPPHDMHIQPGMTEGRARVDELMQALALAVGEDRANTEQGHTAQLVEMQALHDERYIALYTQHQRSEARVRELELSNASLLHELKEAQQATAAAHALAPSRIPPASPYAQPQDSVEAPLSSQPGQPVPQGEDLVPDSTPAPEQYAGVQQEMPVPATIKAAYPHSMAVGQEPASAPEPYAPAPGMQATAVSNGPPMTYMTAGGSYAKADSQHTERPWSTTFKLPPMMHVHQT